MLRAGEISDVNQAEAAASIQDVQEKIIFQQGLTVPHDDMIHFYNGRDCAKLLAADLQKVRDLQDENDRLQRQISQMDKDVQNSSDSLSLLAERERCQIVLARNTGEILKIQIENEQRLQRIAALEEQNRQLKQDIVVQRDQFINTHDMSYRAKHAADFFLSKSLVEKNTAELEKLVA